MQSISMKSYRILHFQNIFSGAVYYLHDKTRKGEVFFVQKTAHIHHFFHLTGDAMHRTTIIMVKLYSSL